MLPVIVNKPADHWSLKHARASAVTVRRSGLQGMSDRLAAHGLPQLRRHLLFRITTAISR